MWFIHKNLKIIDFKSFYLSFTKYSGCTFHQLSLLLFFFYTLHWWFTYYFRWYTVEIHTVLVVQIFKVSVLKISVYLTTGLLKFLSFLTQKIIKKGTKAQEKTKSIKNVCKNTSNISIKFYLFHTLFYCFQYDTYVRWRYASWKHILLQHGNNIWNMDI